MKVPFEEFDDAVDEKSNKECELCLQKSSSSFRRKTKNNYDSKFDLLEEFPEDGNMENSLALVPVQNNETLSRSNSLVVREMSGSKLGWALLRRVLLLKQQHSEKSSGKKPSLIRRVLKIPSRQTSSVVYPDRKNNHSVTHDGHHSSTLDGESGAIVPVGHKVSFPLSPYSSFSKDLDDLTERYSSTCRLFSYKELVLLTSNFLPGMYFFKSGSFFFPHSR